MKVVKTRKENSMIARHKKLVVFVTLVLCLVSAYLFAVYSDIPFVKKWRTIYIETAMSTMTHEWLATAFIPGDVVNEVMSDAEKQFKDNIVDESESAPPVLVGAYESLVEQIQNSDRYTQEEIEKIIFEKNYSEIDISTMPKNTNYAKVVINNAEGKGIKTVQGDEVYAIDTVNGIIIVNVKGSGYVGKLAIVKNSAQVKLGVNTNKWRGSTVKEMHDQYGAILATNASAFIDPNWSSNGLNPAGLVLADGKVKHRNAKNQYFQTIGFDYDDNLIVGKRIDNKKLRDAVEFKPIVVLNGKKKVEGSAGMGLQPRTIIGQSRDKSTLLLVIDGRQIGYSIGILPCDTADILLKYDCYNAMNMDGGSSSVMVYKGKPITRNCTSYNGRTIPDAWIVLPRKALEEKEEK